MPREGSGRNRISGVREAPGKDHEPKPAIVAENDPAVTAQAATLPDRLARRHQCYLAALASHLNVPDGGFALLPLFDFRKLSRPHQIKFGFLQGIDHVEARNELIDVPETPGLEAPRFTAAVEPGPWECTGDCDGIGVIGEREEHFRALDRKAPEYLPPAMS